MNTDQWFLEISLNVAERYWTQAIWSVNRGHFCFARDIVSGRELLGARRLKGTLGFMGDVFASQNGKVQAVLDIEQCDSTIASTSVPMILRIDRPSPSR
jgi:hypothetical protein